MNFGRTKEYQIIDETINLYEDRNVIRCHEHFEKRSKERFNQGIGLRNYIEEQVPYLRGDLVYYNDNRMIRLIGNYHKDEPMIAIIYIKIERLNAYIPLTLYEIVDHKAKYRMYFKAAVIKKSIKSKEYVENH
jgi:hypothetical protein